MSAQKIIAMLVAVLGLMLSTQVFADETLQKAHETLAAFQKTDPGLSGFIQRSAGYAVFPTVGKGGVGVGGAHGSGVVFEHGKPVGKAKVTQVSVGFQLGGQTYSEVIFFETPKALEDFKHGDFALSAQASAVALTAGASAKTKYQNGVAVFTAAKGGLMYEASVGGQKFSFKPLGK